MHDLSIYFCDNLDALRSLPDDSVDLVYMDPPFNTGKVRRHTRLAVVRDDAGDRVGFGGRRYRTVKLGSKTYADVFDNYLDFIEPRLVETRRVLTADGSLFFHIDCREAHYCKVLLDGLFGRASFMNEIIWAYDFGGRSRTRWPAKHDTIFWYAKNPKRYQFHLDACDRIPYMAPGLAGPVKAARGKTPTDTWWHTIVRPGGPERTGYPTQKPRAILDRIVSVHSRKGDLLMDCFAGSGSFGESALALGRRCVLVDNNPEAMRVMAKRFANVEIAWRGWMPGRPGAEATA